MMSQEILNPIEQVLYRGTGSTRGIKARSYIIEEKKDFFVGHGQITRLGYVGKRHRLDGPAYIEYFEDGKILSETFYIEGLLHRTNGPAHITFYESGEVSSETYYINNVCHREDGPARILYDRSGQITVCFYYKNGQIHREDGPANLNYDAGKIESEAYLINGKKHRLKGPAITRYNYSTMSDFYGNRSERYEEYWVNGKQIPTRFIILLREASDKNETLFNIIKEIKTEDIIDNAIELFVHMFKEHLSEKLIKSIESALALC